MYNSLYVIYEYCFEFCLIGMYVMSVYGYVVYCGFYELVFCMFLVCLVFCGGMLCN